MGVSLIWFLVFGKRLSPPPFAFSRLNQSGGGGARLEIVEV
jgi:hypothetical protein